MAENATTARSGPHSFRNLLFFLLLYLFVSPFLAPYPSLALFAHASLTLTLCFAVFAVQKQQNYRSIAAVLLIPVLAVYWLALYDIITFSRIGAYLLLAVFFTLLIVSFSAQLLRKREITAEVIFAALCLYLIIALLWGALHAVYFEIDPGAYRGPLLAVDDDPHLSVFNYFSLVTLTTLGYGDITPETPGAAALCQMEAIVGQFYMAVVIAWSVSTFVTGRNSTPADE